MPESSPAGIPVTCPVCHKAVDITETCVDEKRYHTFWGKRHPTFIRRVIAGEDKDWACAECLGNGLAQRSHYEKQDLQGFDAFPLRPILCYQSRMLHCVKCRCKFEFTANDQLFWYEVAGIYIGVHPKMCLSCRKSSRADKQVSDQIQSLLKALKQKESVIVLRKLEAMYASIGKPAKAGLMHQRADALEREHETEYGKLRSGLNPADRSQVQRLCDLQASLGLADTKEGRKMLKRNEALKKESEKLR